MLREAKILPELGSRELATRDDSLDLSPRRASLELVWDSYSLFGSLELLNLSFAAYYVS